MPSQKKDAQQALRHLEAVLASTQDFVHVFDLSRRFTYANEVLLEHFAQYLGLGHSEVLGKSLSELGCPEEDLKLYEDQIDEVIHRGEPVRDEREAPLFSEPDGEVRVFEYIFTPVLDEEGKVEAVAGIARDVTARRRDEQNKDHFLAVLSHELRNPLAPIELSLHLLDNIKPGSAEARHAREIIGRQVTQLSHLVDDLLDINRINSDKIHLDLQSLELNELTRHVVADHQPLFRDRHIQLELNCWHRPLYIKGDRGRLIQVIGNLLQNAAKFTPPDGQTTVAISFDPRTDRAEIRVRDTGQGMNSESLEHLFNAFAQGASTRKQGSGGLGLGLALVKGLVELHGGQVNATSPGPGKGAEFVVFLPAKKSKDSETTSSSENAKSPGRTILLIEDNLDVAELLQKVLEMKGHQVLTTYSGSEGLKLAKEKHPDVVICDIGLPGISGYAVAEAMRKDPALADTLLIALSGYARPEDVEKSHQAGFDHHLAKPPNIDDLDKFLMQNFDKSAQNGGESSPSSKD